MGLDIWKLLDDDKRVIVKTESREGMIVTWDDNNAELGLWSLSAKNRDSKIDVGWEPITYRSCPQRISFNEARKLAEDWLVEFLVKTYVF
jgi:hypothetical protein